MRNLASGIAFMAALNIPCVTSAQSLRDVARVAEARRREAAATQPARAYTDEDLVEVPRAEPDVDPAPVSPVVSAGTSAKPGPEKGEAYWKDCVRPLPERLENDRALAAATRACAEGLPADADTCFRLGLVCEQYPESRKAQAEYERLLAVIERDEQAVREVEEESRRTGVPPGWLRRKSPVRQHRVDARLASPRYRVRTGLH